MYAVIKTGGKQYRVQPGDILVVEKLEGAPGDAVKFDQVLLTGGDAGVTLGAPTISGAVVDATLIETRKGEKVKVFKKIRRQGYKRTKGHRQQESVVRVTGLTVGGKSEKWDGKVDLTPRSELTLRARNLASRVAAAVTTAAAPKAKAPKAPAAEAHVETVVEAPEGKAPEVKAAVVETNAPETAAKPKAAPKAKEAPKTEAKAEAAPKAAAKPKAEAKTAETTEAAPKAAAKKPAAPKAPKA